MPGFRMWNHDGGAEEVGEEGKKRAAKAVIGTRERRTQDEPMVEGEAVMMAAEAGTGGIGMTGAASGAGQAVVRGRKRESAGSAEEAARGGGKARVGPEDSAAKKRRRAESVTDDEAPVVRSGMCEPVGGAKLDNRWEGQGWIGQGRVKRGRVAGRGRRAE